MGFTIRIYTLKTVILLFVAVTVMYAQQPYSHFKITKISEGVFAAIHTNGGQAICNAGIVDLGDATLVFDSFLTPDAALELLVAAKTLTGKEVRYLVNSHYHNDHMRGNQVFKGCDIISSALTLELMKTRGPEELKKDSIEAPLRLEALKKKDVAGLGDHEQLEHAGMLAYYEGIVNSLGDLVLTYPNVTFENNIRLHGSKRTVELIDMGEGHTPSDVVMWLPDEKTLFAGDLMFIETQPWMPDGNPQNWLRILNRLADLHPETIVPGHGPIGNREAVLALENYIKTVMTASAKLASEPNQGDAIAKLKCPPPYDSWGLAAFYLPNVTMLSKRPKTGAMKK